MTYNSETIKKIVKYALKQFADLEMAKGYLDHDALNIRVSIIQSVVISLLLTTEAQCQHLLVDGLSFGTMTEQILKQGIEKFQVMKAEGFINSTFETDDDEIIYN